jgi:hypothetical protein
VTERQGGFFATVVAVLWSFVGLRRRSGYQQDAAHLKPLHIIVAGVIGGIVFVLTIVMVVRLVVANAA